MTLITKSFFGRTALVCRVEAAAWGLLCGACLVQPLVEAALWSLPLWSPLCGGFLGGVFFVELGLVQPALVEPALVEPALWRLPCGERFVDGWCCWKEQKGWRQHTQIKKRLHLSKWTVSAKTQNHTKPAVRQLDHSKLRNYVRM